MFEDTSSKRSMWTNSNWSWSLWTFSLYSLAVRKWHCFIAFISYFSGMWKWQEWLFDQNFRTFYIVLPPFLHLFLSQLHAFVLFCFFFSWLLLFFPFCFQEISRISPFTPDLLEVITRSWKWWGLVTYQFCYWSRTHVVLNPAILSLTIFRCLKGKCSGKTESFKNKTKQATRRFCTSGCWLPGACGFSSLVWPEEARTKPGNNRLVSVAFSSFCCFWKSGKCVLNCHLQLCF